MKVLSSSSYDYMKLMVLELQQQLSDLEEVERVSGNPAMTPSVNMSNGCAVAADEPSRPPRSKQQQQLQQRVNPFFSEEQSAILKPKKSWAQAHREAGVRIVRDREHWCKDKMDSQAPLIDLAS